jgi:hypothetical protein
MLRTVLTSAFVGVVSVIGEVIPSSSLTSFNIKELSLTGALVFAVYWLGSQNTKISEAAAKREAELKQEHIAAMTKQETRADNRIKKLEDQVFELQKLVMKMHPPAEVTATTKRHLLDIQQSIDDHG